MEPTGVFRQRAVFRQSPTIIRFGSGSVIVAPPISGAIVFGGTAAGSTPGINATATGAIVFAGGPITQIELLMQVAGAIVFGGSATGISLKTASATGPVAFGGTAIPAVFATGPIVFGGSATAATYFTAEVGGAIVFGGAAAAILLGGSVAGAVVFGGGIDSSKIEVSGGVLEASAQPGPILFGGGAAGVLVGQASGAVVFGQLAPPVLTLKSRYRKPRLHVTGSRGGVSFDNN